jgi:hypothetical protein
MTDHSSETEHWKPPVWTYRAEPDPRGGFAVVRYGGETVRLALCKTEAAAVAEAERKQIARDALIAGIVPRQPGDID